MLNTSVRFWKWYIYKSQDTYLELKDKKSSYAI